MKLRERIIMAASAILILISPASLMARGDTADEKGNLSIFSGFGISGARGDYPSEYNAETRFSFSPGLRLRMNDILQTKAFSMVDFGYLQTGFFGTVDATDTYFVNIYDYLNLDLMVGGQSGALYFCGGIYYGIGLGANSYREYTDEWVSLDSNNDFGLVGEIGAELTSFLSLGVQGRYGLVSIGSSVDIRNWGLLATISIHFFHF